MKNLIAFPGQRRLTSSLVILALTTAVGTGRGPDDDANPELVKRTGPRATVVVAEDAFCYRSSEAGGGITVDGPNGKQTYTWHAHSAGFAWNRDKGQALETYFRAALTDTGAFYVIRRDTAEGMRSDNALEREGLQDGAKDQPKLLRPDLKFICTLTKLEENAARTEDNANVGGLAKRLRLPGGLRLGGSKSTQRGECEIMVEIVDRANGVTIATAKGTGFALGGSKSASLGGWQRSIFGDLGTKTDKAVDMTAAIQRATIRAINDVVQKIPAGYFRHELKLGEPAPAAKPADGEAAAPAKTGR